MPTDNPLVPANETPVTAAAAWDPEETMGSLTELLQGSVNSLMQQNIRDVESAVRKSDAIYTSAQRYASADELSVMGIFNRLTRIYLPLTRVLVYQVEGRFPKARQEIAKGLLAIDDALNVIDDYAQSPDVIDEIVDAFKPTVSVISILFRGLDAFIQADIVGYQGNIAGYVKLLQDSVARYREVDQLPPSANPIFIALANMCTSQADRLETRAEVFSALPKQERPAPTGDRIFIVHGHDEAKWRELRDLLEDRLNLKTVILKEEPGAGETLIRKFEEHAANCCYAFVLLTPDDFVKKDGKSYFQARPNVLFELGWFYGAFGRNRVCIVKNVKTALPSDLGGILSIDFSDKVAEGYIQIQDELQRAGIV
jgi:predicted nucleotide-binding protein